MASVGKTGIVRYEETLAVNNIGTGLIGLDGGTNAATGVAWLQSLDTGGASFTRSMSETKGLHLAGSLDSSDGDLAEFCGDQIMFYGQVGHQAVEVMLQVDQASSMVINFGLNDEITDSSNDIPVTLSTSTWLSTATSFIGLVKDFDAANDEFHCFWVDDGNDATVPLDKLRMKGLEFVKDKWCWMRVETQDQGSGRPLVATFEVVQDGKHVAKEFVTSLDRDAALCWYLGIANRAGIARGVFLKLPAWEQGIAD